MPSQRLLKMLDPLGHVPLLGEPQVAALIWGRDPMARWAATELHAAGVTPLRARSIRHIHASLVPGARPCIAIAVFDGEVLGEAERAAVIAARWTGYTGKLVLVGPSQDRRSRALLGVDVTVAPDGPELRALASALERRR